ncbi:MAG: shikimate kinase [Clostridia bacterium]|nr:shikimate kinase [Clostridia bacterium]
MRKNIVLCGFMGSGKSTIGRLLSEKMGMRFIDTDTYIEQKEGMTISEIFAQKGEEYFRELELKVCKELSGLRATVISTGGGTLLKDANVKELKKSGMVFLLNVSSNTVLQRLKNDTSRPLLQRDDKEKAVKMMLSQRIPLYNRAADYVIDAEESPRKVCIQVMNLYNSRQ